MPDTQGTASVIGEFLKGYMGETARQEQKKYADLSSTLSIAEKYMKMAEDPTLSKEEHDHWKQLHVQTLADADKVMNRKSSNLSSIMKIFGLGKKQANGSVATPASDLYKGTGGPRTAPAQMPTPAFMGPEPSIPAEEDLPANFRGGMREYINLQGDSQSAPVAPVANAAPADKYAGWNPIVAYNQRMADYDAERRRTETVKTAQEVGTMQQTIGKQNQAAASEAKKKDIQDQLQVFRANPNYGKDPQYDRAMESHIQFGYVPQAPNPVQKSVRFVDPIKGPTIQTLVDGKVVNEYPDSIDSRIQSIMDEKGLPYKEAQSELGKNLRTAADLTNKSKEGSISNQVQMQQYRKSLMDAQAKKASGTFTPKDAEKLRKDAEARALTLLKTDVMWSFKSQFEKEQDVILGARRWLEGEGFDWKELQGVATGKPASTSAQEESAYRAKFNQGAPAKTVTPPKLTR